MFTWMREYFIHFHKFFKGRKTSQHTFQNGLITHISTLLNLSFSVCLHCLLEGKKEFEVLCVQSVDSNRFQWFLGWAVVIFIEDPAVFVSCLTTVWFNKADCPEHYLMLVGVKWAYWGGRLLLGTFCPPLPVLSSQWRGVLAHSPCGWHLSGEDVWSIEIEGIELDSNPGNLTGKHIFCNVSWVD